MKAIVQNDYGSPEVLEIKEVNKPEITEDQVLIQVHAASINAGDYFSMKGSPWMIKFSIGFPKPKDYILGWDAAGEVAAVGEQVTRFKSGDLVYTACVGAFAEFAVAGQDTIGPKPANLTFEQTAAVPTGGLTALQGLRNIGKVRAGQKVLINGASGGVGTFAVQIAKALGAEVTGVCSTRNVDLVLSLGADEVIDYTTTDFTSTESKYDLILDNVANRSFADLRRALKPEGLIIPNSGHGGMGYVIKAALLSPLTRQVGGMYLTKSTYDDLVVLKDWIESDLVAPVIDRTFPLDGFREAFRHVETGHARGKVVISMT